MPKRQKCTECRDWSIPGMVPRKGKCQYHFNVGAYGQEWADHTKHLDRNPVDANCAYCQRNHPALNGQ